MIARNVKGPCVGDVVTLQTKIWKMLSEQWQKIF